jgi:hypothetical protein
LKRDFSFTVIQCTRDKPDLGNTRKLTNNWDGVSKQFGTSINYTCQVSVMAYNPESI